jgi:hypothetical protein
MSRVVWVLALLSPVIVALFALRWALSDFLLDNFGWHGDEAPRTEPKLGAYGENPEEEFFA